MAFAEVGLNWRDHVDYDSSLARSSDIMCSLGDPAKAAQILDWCSTVKLPEIVARMVRPSAKVQPAFNYKFRRNSVVIRNVVMSFCCG
jgi:hypothetical protein